MAEAGKIIGIVLGAVALVIGLGLLFTILGTFFGGLAGAVVGWMMPNSVPPILGRIFPGATMWQFGAFLGFVGGFLRASVHQTNKEK